MKSIVIARRSLLLSHAIAVALAATCVPSVATATADYSAPALMLANPYTSGLSDLPAYWVSEKFDGIRAYWDGRALLTRAGRTIRAPSWFIAPLPAVPLDGELWMGRGQFQAVAATVRDTQPDDAAWRRVRYLVFDLPRHPGVFEDRRIALEELLAPSSAPWVQPVRHFHVANEAELQRTLERIVAAGGEGLMLHKAGSPYRAIRGDDLLKLKPTLDAEARVVGHLPGRGKYLGMTGALLVETATGVRFRLGTGLTDAERRDPPPLGSWVTYSHEGYTAAGIPRFGRYVRMRASANGE